MVSTESRAVVFEALPVVFIEKRGFSFGQLGLIYSGMFRASVGCLDLTSFQSCLWRCSPGGCDLRLGLEENGGARGEMGGIPTSGDKTDRCYSRRPTPGDRLLLARLERRVHQYPLVRPDALDDCDWLRGKPGVRFIHGELLVLVRRTRAHSVSRAT